MGKPAWNDEPEAVDPADVADLGERGPKEPSANAKEVAFIVTDRRYHYHATYKRAKGERGHLSAQHGKKFRILRVLNIPSERIALYETAPELQEALREALRLVDAGAKYVLEQGDPSIFLEYARAREPLRAVLAKSEVGANG